jgi:hypothetical protein
MKQILTYFKSFLSSFTSAFDFIKKYIYIIVIVLILLLICYAIIITKKYNKNKLEKNRVTAYYENSKFKIDSLRTFNGKLIYSVNILEQTKKEFQTTNSELLSEINELNFKLKNISGITKIQYIYVYKNDTILAYKRNDTTFVVKFFDDYLTFNELIMLYNNKTSIEVDSLQIKLSDSLTIVNENIYKRRWIFWRKLTGVKLNISTENPYFKLNKIQSIKID